MSEIATVRARAGRLIASRARVIRVADLLAGAGGSATGCKKALDGLGLGMDLVAVNHWATAIETHKLNHPTAKHFCVDVYRTKPIEAVPSGKLDLLMASPTCTFFSRAKGGAPVSWDQRRGRMTPHQVIRWVKDLDVSILIVENVPEFVEWGPLHKAVKRCDERLCECCKIARVLGIMKAHRKVHRCCIWKPNPAKAGKHFRAWIRRLENEGYQVQHRILNAANYGEATTRKRFFLIGRKDRKRIVWPRRTHSQAGVLDLFGEGGEKWRAAREIINWHKRGRSIFRRKDPLATKTLERILAGAIKFGWHAVYHEALRLHIRGESVEHLLCKCEEPDFTDGSQPIAFQVNQGGDRARNIRSVESPMPTLVTRPSFGLAQPLVVRSGMLKSNARNPRSTEQPIPTVTTDGGLALVVPQGNDTPARSVEDPLSTVVTIDRHAIVVANRSGNAPRSSDEPVPPLTTSGGGGVFILNRHGDNGSVRAHSVDRPLPTADCRGASFVLSQGAGGAPREVDKPVPTIVSDGAVSLVSPYYGTGACSSVEKPLPTTTTRDRFGLVVPLTHHDKSNRSRSTDDPLPTVTGAPRGELAFVIGAFGERPGQAPRVHSIDEPAPTVLASGRIPLAHACSCGGIDILFRMFETDELAGAMGFNDSETQYKFAGNKTEVTRQIGNAVSVRQAAALVSAIFEQEAR